MDKRRTLLIDMHMRWLQYKFLQQLSYLKASVILNQICDTDST